MKYSIAIFFTLTLFIYACKNKSSNQTKAVVATDTLAKQRFFPVTNYIKGQLFDIKQKGVNPLKYTTIDNRTDSVWLKIEDLSTAVSEFRTPVIDSANLNTLFLEKSFKDQTLNAITFTYEPIAKIPDSISLSNWNVYIEPETGNVKSIYLVKTIGAKTIQLTWTNNTNCKMVYLTSNADGSFKIEKEEKIVWDF